MILLLTVGRVKAFAIEEDIYKESGAAELVEEGEDEDLADSLWRIISTAYDGAIGGAFKHAGIIFACLIMLSLMENTDRLRLGEGSFGFGYISAVVLSAACFPALYTVFSYTKAAVEGLCTFSVSLLPVMTALYSMGGNTAQGISNAGGLGLFLSAAQLVCGKLLMPVLSLGFAFTLTGLLPGTGTLGTVTGFIKNAVCMLIAFVFSLVCFVFYFQTAVSGTADNFAYRSVKFASGAFIPVIGNAVGDSARTVFGAVSSVKGVVGGYGLTVMLSYLLPPIVSAVLYKLAFGLCTVGAKLCGMEKQSKFLGDLNGLLGVSLALLIAVSVVFTVISAVFLKSGVTV